MASEQMRTLKALRMAIQMEIDGKEYYLKISQQASSKMGENLLRSLSKAEDSHRQKFIDIYGATRDKNKWPNITLKPTAKNMSTVFSKATKKTAGTETLPEEADAVIIAMKMENQTVDFYTKQAAKAQGETEKRFYDTITSEEREHHKVLQDYFEFLKDPTGFFVRTEHHSLDGG